jgi:hypothetical protein
MTKMTKQERLSDIEMQVKDLGKVFNEIAELDRAEYWTEEQEDRHIRLSSEARTILRALESRAAAMQDLFWY